jgi:hypothetical protein
MTKSLLALPAKKARRWTAKTITFLAAFYLTEEEKESMPSGVFSAPIVASEIYMPAVGDTWIYQGEFLVAVHRHSGAFKKYSRGVRVPPIVVYAKQPTDASNAEFQAFLMKIIDQANELD